MEEVLVESIPGLFYGGLIGGLLYGTKHYFNRDKNMARKLHFEPEAFDQDRIIGESFLRLQKFRPYSPQAFDEGGNQVDSILCLEKQIMQKEIDPSMFHSMYATRYARSAYAYLKQLQDMIEIRLKKRDSGEVEEMKYAKELIAKIKIRVQYHVKNITGLYKMADKRIARPVLQYPPENS